MGSDFKAPRPVRFGPEWWAAYGAAFAVERGAFDGPERADYDRVRRMRSSIAERCATIADDAIEGFLSAVAGGCIGDALDEPGFELPRGYHAAMTRKRRGDR